MECEKGTVECEYGTCIGISFPRNVNKGPWNVNRGPWNVNKGPLNAIMGMWDVIMRP